LENPLPWDTIESAPYEKMNRVEPALAELRRRSEARTAADPDWAYVRDEIERYKKALAEKSVSMNEADRLKEKKENDQRAKARKKELAARPEPNEKVYEITLKLTDEPGLPPPVAKTNHVAAAEAHSTIKLEEGTNNKPRLAKADTKPAAETDAASPAKSDDDPEDSLDEKVPNLDITLEETKRILADYISLYPKQSGLAVTGQKK